MGVLIMMGASLVVSLGMQLWGMKRQNDQLSEAKDQAKETAQEQVRVAKMQHLKQFNAEVQQYNRATMLAKQKLITEKRKEASKGNPVA